LYVLPTSRSCELLQDYRPTENRNDGARVLAANQHHHHDASWTGAGTEKQIVGDGIHAG
jgi:hypothetical protein